MKVKLYHAVDFSPFRRRRPGEGVLSESNSTMMKKEEYMYDIYLTKA